MTSSMTHPPVLWAQRNDTILLTVGVNDIRNEKFSLDENKLAFYGEGGENQFAFDLAFYKEVTPQESKHSKTARGLFFIIKKKESGPYWPRLMAEKIKHPYIKTDFNRWKDESDSESEAEFDQDSNLQAMMQQMGGLGGGSLGGGPPGGDLPAMNDMSSDDSDDEPVPVETETTPT